MEETLVQRALTLVSAYSIPNTFKAVLELGVLDIIASAGLASQLSPAQIAAKIPTTNPHAPVMLDRMLRYLASHSLLTCSEVTTADGADAVERRYGLASVCMLFIKTKGERSPLAALLFHHLDKAFQDSWQQLKYAVLEDVIPFAKVHGKKPFDYAAMDPRFSRMFNETLSDLSDGFTKGMLGIYTGFQDIEELVDVGGGYGTTLHLIMSKYPKIKGINFDLPHVISVAPPLPGVEHVGGDMFANIPSAKAIFMKFILHDWNDEHCLKLLKNCFEALPSSGKLIIVDNIIPEVVDTDASTQNSYWIDLAMMTYFGGKERTKKEFKFLAKEAGFATLNVVASLFSLSVMELLK